MPRERTVSSSTLFDWLFDLLGALDVFAAVLDRKGRIALCNAAFAQTSGYAREELVDKDAAPLLTATPTERTAFARAIAAVLDADQDAAMQLLESTWRAHSDQQHAVRWILAPAYNPDTVPPNADDMPHVLALGRNRTRERTLAHETIRTDDKLRHEFGEVLSRCLTTPLAGASMLAHAFTQRSEEERPSTASDALHTLTRTIQQTTKRTQALACSYLVPELETDGLAAALDCLAQRAEAETDITCLLSVGGVVHSATPDEAAEQHLYRIAEEAVRNALRHATPSEVKITLDARHSDAVNASDAAALRLIISDDGQGLPEEVTEGIGMRTMRRRAAEIGARLRFESAERGRGTVVRCTLPFSSTRSNGAS